MTWVVSDALFDLPISVQVWLRYSVRRETKITEDNLENTYLIRFLPVDFNIEADPSPTTTAHLAKRWWDSPVIPKFVELPYKMDERYLKHKDYFEVWLEQERPVILPKLFRGIHEVIDETFSTQ